MRGWLLCALSCLAGAAAGQETAERPGQPAKQEPPETLSWAEGRAAFVLRRPDATDPGDDATDGSPRSWTLVLGEQRTEAGPAEAEIGHVQSDGWLLDTWTPSPADETGVDLPSQFAFRPLTGWRGSAGRADRWARSVYSRDAELLTPLTAGREMIGWEVADGLTISGVGSRRVWTERDRAFIVSAEAGLRLSPRAGFQLGYELLQASTGGTLPSDLGGEAVFARFQLRF